MSSDTIIELRQVYKSFGALKVLSGVDLALKRGHTTVILGESGTGKSVLIKHMVGLLRPDRGQVYFNGQRVDNLGERDWRPVRQRFGYLFQMSALFDSLTVEQNVAFPIVEQRNLSDEQVKQIVAHKLSLVGLEGTQQKRPAELSGGQRKRVALARAIALEPDVILYDEPTTGLDPIRTDAINDLILKLQEELKVTSVVVTHDMSTAFKTSDRILMLHQGCFIADGTADDFRDSTDPRVRRFVAGQFGREEEDDGEQMSGGGEDDK